MHHTTHYLEHKKPGIIKRQKELGIINGEPTPYARKKEPCKVHTLVDHNELAEMMRGSQNHIRRKKQAKYKLPIIPLDNAFITSPVDIPGPRKVDLQDTDITPSMRSVFDALCEKYPKVFSKGNEDIGRTQLVTMDIDTGDSPLVSSRPYTLALKHHRWVQCKRLFTGFCRVGTFYQFPCFAYGFLVFSFRGVRFLFGEYL